MRTRHRHIKHISNKTKDKRGKKDWRRARGRTWANDFDLTCRPGGGCPWCRSNRQHKHRRSLANLETV